MKSMSNEKEKVNSKRKIRIDDKNSMQNSK